MINLRDTEATDTWLSRQCLSMAFGLKKGIQGFFQHVCSGNYQIQTYLALCHGEDSAIPHTHVLAQLALENIQRYWNLLLLPNSLENNLGIKRKGP